MVPGDRLTGAERRFAGTAFDVAVRLRLGAETDGVTDSIEWALDCAASIGVRFPEQGLREGGRTLEAAGAAGPTLPRAELLRTAVVIGWCETATRSLSAVMGCPLAEMPAAATWAELCDQAPAPVLADLDELLAVAESALLPELANSATGRRAADVRVQVDMSLGPVRAEVDLLTGPALLELKTGAGRSAAGAAVFPLDRTLLRQLAGYALLPAAAAAGIKEVGVYAARFGQLWRTNLDELLRATTTWYPHTGTPGLEQLRAATTTVLGPRPAR